MRISSSAALAVAAIAAVTVWVTWRAKALEKDLDGEAAKVTLVDHAAPDFSFPSLQGGTASLANYRGRKLVLIFWASWNIGSHAAALSLNTFYKAQHKPDSDFDFAAVNVDDDEPAARKFISDSRTTYPVMLATRKFASGTFGVRRVPTVLLIDAAGKITWGSSGNPNRMIGDLADQLGIKGYHMEFGRPNGPGN